MAIEELLEPLIRSLYAILHRTCAPISFEDLYRDAYSLVLLPPPSLPFKMTLFFVFLGIIQTCGRTLQFDSTVNSYISARRGINLPF